MINPSHRLSHKPCEQLMQPPMALPFISLQVKSVLGKSPPRTSSESIDIEGAIASIYLS